MKKMLITRAYFILFTIFKNTAFGWDNNSTHKQISRIAAEYAVLGKDSGDYLKYIGFSVHASSL